MKRKTEQEKLRAGRKKTVRPISKAKLFDELMMQDRFKAIDLEAEEKACKRKKGRSGYCL